MTPLQLAIEHIRAGRAPVPVPFRGKNPGDILGKGWIEFRATEETAPRHFDGKPLNVGVILGAASHELVDVDLDCPEAIEIAPRILPGTATFGRPSKPRSHYVYQARPAAGRIAQHHDPAGGMIVEYRADGGQTVFPGSVHESGEPIAWTDDTPIATVDAVELRRGVARLAAAVLLARAGVSSDDAVALVQSEAPDLSVLPDPALARASQWLGLNVARQGGGRHEAREPGDIVDRARKYLLTIPGAVSGQGGHPATFHAAQCLTRGFDLDDSTAFDLLREWNGTCKPPWSDRELQHKVTSSRRDGQMVVGSLRDAEPPRARRQTPRDPSPPTDPSHPLNAPDGFDAETGEIPMDESPAGEPEPTPEAAAPQAPKARRFNLTDLGNAERLAARYGSQIRYCPPKRKWLVWDGRRWAWDDRGEINRIAKKTVRAIYAEASDEAEEKEAKAIAAWAAKSEASDKLAALVKLAQSEPGIAVMPQELDANPWLFNCENGTVDLRTGTLRSHDRRDLCTKIAPVRYDPEARSELWEKYLRDATGDDAALTSYLQRVAGYALAGVAPEKCLFFLYGPSNSTKSTFIDALSAAMGDYHVSAAFSTWCVQSNVGGNRGDLVRLAGARLVTSVEIRKGARWDEEIMKRVVGGDEIAAAAKYEAEITFRATFTMLLAANDAPKVRDDDEGLWNRMRRVPFVRVPATRDPGVKATLSDPAVSGPAILAWAVQGCLAWQREGLGTAPAVDNSTNAYRQEMDRIAAFLDDQCEFGPHLRVWRNTFRDSYQRWCQEMGIKVPLTPQEIAARLRERGVDPGKSDGMRVWIGVGLRQGQRGSERDTDPQNFSHERRQEKVTAEGDPVCPCVTLSGEPDESPEAFLDRCLPRGDA